MSKKDLLERLSRQSDGSAARRGADGAVPRTHEDAVTTRVSRKVVRRRRRADEGDGDAEGVDVEASDAGESVSDAAPAPAPAVEPTPERVVESRPAPEPAPAPEPVPEPVPVASAPAREPEVEPAPAPAAEPAPAPAPAAEPVPVPEPAPVAEVPRPQRREPEPVPVDEPVMDDEPMAAQGQGEDLPQQARFAGLGKAVVMPPPGYDPSNPHAWRREQPGGADPGAPSRGRRRVEASAPGRPSPVVERDRRRGGGGAPGAGAGRPSSRQQPFDARMRRKPRRKRVVGPKASSPAPKASKRKVRVDHVISVRDLAKQLQIKASLVIKTLMDMGQMATITEMLDIESATLVANEFEYEVDNVGFQEDEFLQHVGEEEEEEGMVTRPPVVTIMGHVDHGKTTLLDAIRSSRVAKGEAGGITQHIGAYQVEVGEDATITFLDTPGHEAFTSMRARGASVTDIVVLVVAADDGVQPQTAEAISHAKAAGVPIIVAINKMDKAGVNPDTIKQQLTEYELLPEEWGGDTLFAPVSALRGDGIDDLLEQIHLQAEILDLRANPDRHAEGVVIEAQMERGRGAVATVLIQQGTLQQGDYVVLGSAFGRVRAMVDHRGKRLKSAGPSTPVELFGLSDLPEVGDDLAVVTSEKNARTLADHRAEHKRLMAMSEHRRNTAEDLFAAAARGNLERLHIILKADVQGTLQALKASLEKIEVEGTEVKVLLAAVGDISESDVNLAASDDAVLLGFNVKLDAKARQAADSKGVEPELYNVIYALLDSVQARLKGMLAPEYRQVLNGKAEVRALFHISKVGTVAGCYVQEGIIARADHARLVRDGKTIHEGPLRQLKRFKDDVREVRAGFECGISLEGMNEIEEGDIIEAYRMEQVERT